MAKYSDEERSILSQASEMSDFIRSPGWDIYKRIITSQIEERMQIILAMEIEGISDFLKIERLKGSLIALKGLASLPESIINHAEMIRRDHSPLEEDK